MEANGDWVLSMATAKPGVLVKAPAIRPTILGVSMSKKIFHSDPCQAGRSHNQQCNQNQGFSLAPERMEETRTGLNANRKDKQHQPEGSQFLWNGYPPNARRQEQ